MIMSSIPEDKIKEENNQMLIAIEKYLDLIKLEFLEHLQKYKMLYENVFHYPLKNLFK